ncbi:hypothetical protein DL769_000515 [Monosporascus sp. CRB-8-3]|nr:hypothetical protein DL769_000515 [Monosporascus sp. CRB-8-3]
MECDEISEKTVESMGEKKFSIGREEALAVHVEERCLSSPPGGLVMDMTVSRMRGIAIIATLACINFLNTMGSGILIAALPRIAKDVNIPDGLILWPAAVYALAAGCLLHVFGAIGDIVGPKSMWVVGSFLFVVFTVAVGLAATSMQIILFRTCLGMAMSMCLPTTVSLITNTFARGQWRNTAFAMNGMAQPLGYALGLVLGGIFTDTIGWRWSYYIMAMVNFCVSVTSIWSLPTVTHPSKKGWARQLREDVDWVGAIILSVSLGILIVSNLLISDALPADEQSLAGGVFNQFAQFGNSVGLAITAVIAASVKEHSNEPSAKIRLMDGFRAAFWAIFASTGAVIVISAVGFRKAGVIGQKGTVDEDIPPKTPEAGSLC